MAQKILFIQVLYEQNNFFFIHISFDELCITSCGLQSITATASESTQCLKSHTMQNVCGYSYSPQPLSIRLAPAIHVGGNLHILAQLLYYDSNTTYSVSFSRPPQLLSSFLHPQHPKTMSSPSHLPCTTQTIHPFFSFFTSFSSISTQTTYILPHTKLNP